MAGMIPSFSGIEHLKYLRNDKIKKWQREKVSTNDTGNPLSEDSGHLAKKKKRSSTDVQREATDDEKNFSNRSKLPNQLSSLQKKNPVVQTDLIMFPLFNLDSNEDYEEEQHKENESNFISMSQITQKDDSNKQNFDDKLKENNDEEMMFKNNKNESGLDSKSSEAREIGQQFQKEHEGSLDNDRDDNDSNEEEFTRNGRINGQINSEREYNGFKSKFTEDYEDSEIIENNEDGGRRNLAKQVREESTRLEETLVDGDKNSHEDTGKQSQDNSKYQVENERESRNERRYTLSSRKEKMQNRQSEIDSLLSRTFSNRQKLQSTEGSKEWEERREVQPKKGKGRTQNDRGTRNKESGNSNQAYGTVPPQLFFESIPDFQEWIASLPGFRSNIPFIRNTNNKYQNRKNSQLPFPSFPNASAGRVGQQQKFPVFPIYAEQPHKKLSNQSRKSTKDNDSSEEIELVDQSKRKHNDHEHTSRRRNRNRENAYQSKPIGQPVENRFTLRKNVPYL